MHTVDSAKVSDRQLTPPSLSLHGRYQQLHKKTVVLSHVAHSDAGLARLKNQDAWKVGCGNRLFALADGIGGRRAGEIASQSAVDALCHTMERSLPKLKSMTFQETSHFLQRAIEHINGQIFEMGCRDDQRQGMGTTLCCLYQCQSAAVFAHVGDSRVYLRRKENLIQLTQDHSFKQMQEAKGRAKGRDSSDYLRTILTRAIGVKHRVTPTVGACRLLEGDRLMLCSDGLSDVLSTDEINRALAVPALSQKTVRQLIERAKDNGSRDNITAVLIEVIAPDGGDLLRQ